MGNAASIRRRRLRHQDENPDWMAAMNFSRHKSICAAELEKKRKKLRESNGKTESATQSSTSSDEVLGKSLSHPHYREAWIPEMHVPLREIEITRRKNDDEDVASQVDALFAYWYTRSKPEAYWVLGTCHFRGIGVQRDPTEAVSCWEKAAAHEHRDAMYALGATFFNCECEHLSEDDQLRQSVNWFQKASNLGDTDATSALAVCYQFGIGVEKDFSKSAASYLANMPFGHLYLILDRVYRKFDLPLIDNKFHQHDEEEILKLRTRANKLSKKLRQMGDKALDSTLGKSPSSIPQSLYDCAKALEQCLPELLNENPEALYCLGEIHQYLSKEKFCDYGGAGLHTNGGGDELKRERCWHHGFRLFLMAAELGHPRAVFRVGQILAESKAYESLFLEDACFLMDSATIFHRSKNEKNHFPSEETFYDYNKNGIYPHGEHGSCKIERYYLEQEESHLLRLGIQW